MIRCIINIKKCYVTLTAHVYSIDLCSLHDFNHNQWTISVTPVTSIRTCRYSGISRKSNSRLTSSQQSRMMSTKSPTRPSPRFFIVISLSDSTQRSFTNFEVNVQQAESRRCGVFDFHPAERTVDLSITSQSITLMCLDRVVLIRTARTATSTEQSHTFYISKENQNESKKVILQ